MSFTFAEFQSKLNQTAGTVAGATAATVVNNVDNVNKVVDATKSAAVKTGSTVKGILPASNKKVDSIAAKFNSRLNNVEMNQRVDDVYISMIAQATGVNLPSREEVIEALAEQDEADKAAQITEAVVDAVNNPEIMNMVGMFMQKLFGMNPMAPVVEEVEDDEEEEIVEVIVEPKPKKAKKEQPKQEENVVTKAEKINKGRRKLGRQAPLAE